MTTTSLPISAVASVARPSSPVARASWSGSRASMTTPACRAAASAFVCPFQPVLAREGFVTFPAGQPWVRHESFRQEPDLEPLGTPSGLIGSTPRPSLTTAMGIVRVTGLDRALRALSRRAGQQTVSAAPAILPPGQAAAQPALLLRQLPRHLHGTGSRASLYESTGCQIPWPQGRRSGAGIQLRGQVLAGLVVSDDYAPGVVRIQEGAWYGPQEGGKVGTLCTYGDPNVLTADIGSSSLAQATTAHTALVEIESSADRLPPSLPSARRNLPRASTPCSRHSDPKGTSAP